MLAAVFSLMMSTFVLALVVSALMFTAMVATVCAFAMLKCTS